MNNISTRIVALVKSRVFEALDNARDNGAFEDSTEFRGLKGANAEYIANDLMEFDSLICQLFEGAEDELALVVQAWLDKEAQ